MGYGVVVAILFELEVRYLVPFIFTAIYSACTIYSQVDNSSIWLSISHVFEKKNTTNKSISFAMFLKFLFSCAQGLFFSMENDS